MNQFRDEREETHHCIHIFPLTFGFAVSGFSGLVTPWRTISFGDREITEVTVRKRKIIIFLHLTFLIHSAIL